MFLELDKLLFIRRSAHVFVDGPHTSCQQYSLYNSELKPVGLGCHSSAIEVTSSFYTFYVYYFCVM
jgi:hypothetical protein